MLKHLSFDHLIKTTVHMENVVESVYRFYFHLFRIKMLQNFVFDSSHWFCYFLQATLGNGTGSKRTVVMCNVGGRGAVILCSLVPDKSESCSLDLEFNEESEVIFSVDGTGVVHLSGYYCGHSGDGNSTYPFYLPFCINTLCSIIYYHLLLFLLNLCVC